MYLITYNAETRRILSCGEVNPKYMVKALPTGAAYVETLPDSPISNYLYTKSGEYALSKEENDATDQD